MELATMKKTTQLKRIIKSKKLQFLMEAHNGLSAKIVEEEGFSGIWGSGLSISAAMGVRDNNEASWTQVLEVLEFMSDNTSIPILLDGDTGYGNFNNVRRLIKKLEQRKIAGVCIEDKLFPKTNSFISGEAQPLADMNEFAGKITAAKDSQEDPDFVVVARVEAFIAGWGLGEALKRAECYRKAGADAILMHSKISSANQIESFMKEWGNRHPIVIVPTKYYSTPTEKFKNLGVSTIIWANHNLRASISNMQKISKQIFNDKSLINVENNVVPVAEIFRLQGAEELKEAEKKYLPASTQKTNAIILAASKGDNFGELTKEIPKALLNVNGKTILYSQLEALNNVNIKDILVVRGFAKNKIKELNIKTIDNDEFDQTSELYSLFLAKDVLKNNTIITYGDILFKQYILHDLLNDQNDITIVVDSDHKKTNGYQDFVSTNLQHDKKSFFSNVTLNEISSKLDSKNITGEFIGMWKVNETGAKIVLKMLEKLSKKENFKQMRMSDLFNETLKNHTINVRFIKGSWIDVDSIVDLQRAGELHNVEH
jgi:phosphoenolpyruvate phosphomutase